MEIVLDKWQQEVFDCKGKKIAIRKGRQVGGSTVISMKGCNFAIENPHTLTMIVSATERQAQLLFEKTLGYAADNYKKEIKRGKDRPTKHVLKFRNGSSIYCLPTGMTGYGIRGYTIDLFIADEAAFIPDAVFDALTPSLAISRGKIILLSTPMGKQGFFYKCFSNPNYKTWHVSSLNCPRRDEEFLAQEKSDKSALVWAQEYLGEFVDELRQFFPDELIHRCMTKSPPPKLGDNFLGVDIARHGEDDTVLLSVRRLNRENLYMTDMVILNKVRLTLTADRILMLYSQHNYKKIYIDTTGIGWGVFDILLEDSKTASRVVSIENVKKSLNRDKDQKTRTFKEDLYSNLLTLMQSGKIYLFEDDELFQSLKSVQYEYKEGKIKIFGKYTHIAEALIRAAWCMKSKTLNLWVR